ncbi:YciI family protein [Phenylobacterium sp.]|uniref:YciI family protein n=1 Tax=Phenylobacterium sp. TaxID=1871053 RepID=UPI0027330D72|nr:YciI family protein [Phenylobacterium sp.]MDP3852111.1 YciI family protein [Phenylobacterium sp.]
MRFLCLGYYDAAKMDALPKPEIDAIMAQCRPHLDDLHATRQVLLDLGLEVETRSVRRVDGAVRITQGRVVESHALIGSAFVIEARDFEEAIAVASKHPSTQVPAGEQFGWAVEIRPIHTYRAPTKAEPLKA